MSEDMPDRMSERMSEDMPERMFWMPQDMPERKSEYLPDRVPERMSEDMPDRMPERMSERMSEDMPDRMSEDMPDKMSEDMLDISFQSCGVCSYICHGGDHSKWRIFFTWVSCRYPPILDLGQIRVYNPKEKWMPLPCLPSDWTKICLVQNQALLLMRPDPEHPHLLVILGRSFTQTKGEHKWEMYPPVN